MTQAVRFDAPEPKRRGSAPPASPLAHIVYTGLVKWHIIAAVGWLLVALLAGLAFSLQFIQLYKLPQVPLLSPGRVRMVHTNMIAFAFLTNAFFGMLYWTIPRLTGQRVLSKKLGWLIFFAWQTTVGLTLIGLLTGHAQGVLWGETPHDWPTRIFSVDNFVVLGAVLVALQFYTPIVRTTERAMYVSLWYFSAAFVWLALTYLMGNYLPQDVVGGAEAGPLLGLYIHDLVGLWVTPMGWGMMYFFVPIILKKPIWSHALSLVGFWGLAFFYPLQGVHHFLYSPIPMFAQYGAVVSTIAVEVVVLSVIINFFMTLRGSETAVRDDYAARWFFMGAFDYFVTCLQCAFQVTLTFQPIIHFNDWVRGHSHLVMGGVFAFWVFGMVEHLWPKLTGREWWSQRLRGWFFWLTATGLFMMFLDLTCAGLVEGFMSRALSPWNQGFRLAYPFWLFRTITGVSIISGFLCLLVNMAATALIAKAPHVDAQYAPYESLEEATTHGTV